MTIYTILFYIICVCAYVIADSGVKFTAPIKSKAGWAFQGRLFENTSTVLMTPPIMAIPVKGISKSMSICGYTVHHDTATVFPFVVLLVDQKRGYAEVKLKANVAKDRLGTLYTFQIEAYDCDTIPHFSERKFVLVEIKSSQHPIFSSSSYHFVVKLGTAVGTKIGTITAFERPEKMTAGTESQGICKYSLLSSFAVPFNIDQFGVLSTKVLVLEGVQSKRYRFKVQANDCSKQLPRTNSVPVTVDVFDDCKPHWTGLVSSVEYNGDKGVLPIISRNQSVPSLHLCSGNCEDLMAIVSVKLQGKDIRPASSNLCKHDIRSLRRQEQLCDITKNGEDLLTMVPEQLHDNENGGFYFPGNVGVAVAVDSKFNKFGHGSTRKFTIMFWMQHSTMEVNGAKEQILCNSDGQVHNRHHFSVFLHNCKLIVLMRKEYGEAKPDQYEPAEWRYGPLIEVCDNKWHHYAVMYNDGTMFLQIDGEMTKTTLQHLDDRPLLASPAGQTDTKFTVGACYHSKSDNFVQHFTGHLASLRLFDGELEAINNIRCVATCGEALLMPHIIDNVGIQSSVTLFSDSVVIRSHDIYNLLKMFAGLSYINTEISDEIHGRRVLNRTVTISVDIHCDGNQVSSASPRSIIIHLKEHTSRNSSTVSSIRIETRSLIRGRVNEKIPLLTNLRFLTDNDAMENIESCIIRPVGHVIQSWEYIDWPISIIINLHLTGLNNSHGLVLEGKQEVRVYQVVLSKIFYVTSKYDAMHSERQFAVSCSLVDKSVMSEAIVTVEIEEPDLKTYYVVDDPTQDQKDSSEIVLHHARGSKTGFNEKEETKHKVKQPKGPSTMAVWVILGCLLLVAVVITVGAVFAYKKYKKQQRKVFLNDIAERGGSRMKVISNPLMNGGVCDGINDDNVNDIPGSAGEEYDDEDYEEEDDEDDQEDVFHGSTDNKERINIPKFLRIPLAPHTRSVDV